MFALIVACHNLGASGTLVILRTGSFAGVYSGFLLGFYIEFLQG